MPKPPIPLDDPALDAVTGGTGPGTDQDLSGLLSAMGSSTAAEAVNLQAATQRSEDMVDGLDDIMDGVDDQLGNTQGIG
jgi:hypothetical protein